MSYDYPPKIGDTDLIHWTS